MSSKEHDKLKAEAKKKGLIGDKYDAYVYGTPKKKSGWHSQGFHIGKNK